MGLTTADLDTALRDFNWLVDTDRDALELLLRQAQIEASQRRFGNVRCADIMSRGIVSVEFATPLDGAWALLHQHRIRAMPVVDRAGRVIGVVTMVDFLKQAQLNPRDHRSLGLRIQHLLVPAPGDYSDKAEVVVQFMTSPVQTAAEQESVIELVPRLSNQGLHHVPVVDGGRRLSGTVTQSDLVAALYRSQFSGQPGNS